MMQFRILGPLEARTSNGEIAPLTAAKHRVLLSMLLLHAGRTVSADGLIDELWPERPPRSAPAILRTYASTLRTSLSLAGQPDGPVLARHPGGYRLDLSAGALDVQVFHRLAEQGERAAAAGDLCLAAERLHGAVALWRGRPAEDIPLNGHVLSVVAGLEERYVEVQETWLRARLLAGPCTGLLADLRALVSRHPLRETLTELLMKALYKAGRQADALAVYAQIRRALIAELGLEPGPRLRRLHRSILRQEDLVAASGDSRLELMGHRALGAGPWR